MGERFGLFERIEKFIDGFLYKNDDLLNLLRTDSKGYYEGYDYPKQEIECHRVYIKGKIIENIQTYVQEVVKENRDIGKFEIRDRIRSDLAMLTKSEYKKIISLIKKITKKFNIVREFIDFENGWYKTPKELLCSIRGIENPKIIEKITDDVEVEQYGLGLMFYVGDEISYYRIRNLTSPDINGSGGFFCSVSEIPELECSLSVINGRKSDNKVSTQKHEGQHNRNSYFMPDDSENEVSRAKNEIIAHLRAGTGISRIWKSLTETGEKGLYQYGLEGEDREDHKKQVKELLDYVNDLIDLVEYSKCGLTRGLLISMLIATPVDERKNLHSIIMGSMKKYKDGISKIRWTGTTEMKGEIGEINKANSIDEIKHILKDPKYSHISRGPNNKGGIEISAMIDEVIAGYLPITFLPPEIREIIEMFIEK